MRVTRSSLAFVHTLQMVLVMIKGANDLGLGVLTSMIWIDVFYLCLFCIIALGLFETILVHSLFRSGLSVHASGTTTKPAS